MSETKPSMPAQPKTTELEAVRVPANQLDAVLLEVRMMREESSTRHVEVSDRFVEVSTRMEKMENRIDDLERRQGNASIRAKEPSQHDVELKGELNAERQAREELAKKVDSIETKTDAQTVMLTTLTEGASKLFANPMVRSIATMLGTAALTWLAAHGGVK